LKVLNGSQIFKQLRFQRLKRLSFEQIKRLPITVVLTEAGAYWIYLGKDGEPHVILASEKHSVSFLDLRIPLELSNIRQAWALMMANLYWSKIGKPVDFVASSSYTGFSIGQDFTNALAKLQGEAVAFVYTETEWNGNKKKFQNWTGKLELPDDAIGILCDDLWTTGKTTKSVFAQVAEKNNVQFVEKNDKPVVMTIVHRP